jgi:POT family proton-dependent oligopeptide transporter
VGGAERRNLNPSLPVKFGLGLILLSAGFVVMAGAASWSRRAINLAHLVDTQLPPHTFGELCLNPVGFSSVTKLAPRRLVGQMMGIWFLGIVVGKFDCWSSSPAVRNAVRKCRDNICKSASYR